ncbi:hypothetical protein SAZ11_14420 [Streptomyces sp. FXJ1.4098]|nr:hypothetical protein [Streptomyces sp. FXJ1.4098]
MDKAFGETDAGRVLLVADMEMKRDFSRAMDPKKSPGKEFMNAAPKVDGVPCWGSGRNWIVPGRAKVREQDGGIYILDAPLKVNHAAMDFDTPVQGEDCSKKLTKAEKERSHRLITATSFRTSRSRSTPRRSTPTCAASTSPGSRRVDPAAGRQEGHRLPAHHQQQQSQAVAAAG